MKGSLTLNWAIGRVLRVNRGSCKNSVAIITYALLIYSYFIEFPNMEFFRRYLTKNSSPNFSSDNRQELNVKMKERKIQLIL